MRQSITHKQWFEITDRQRATFLKASGKAIDDFVIGVGLSLPLPTIGELIAFLDVHGKAWKGFEITRLMEEDDEDVLVKVAWSVRVAYGEVQATGDELCDALWNAVKLLLNERQEG